MHTAIANNNKKTPAWIPSGIAKRAESDLKTFHT